MPRWRFAFPLCALLALAASTRAEETPAFRIDGGADDKLPYFQLKPNEYPPEKSGHHIAGELIGLDYLNRSFTLRADRTDAQRRSDWDQPLPFTLLPFGVVRYHGAPAELRHIPINTHLHGQMYEREFGPKEKREVRPGIESDFTKCILLEDDFSNQQRLKKFWRVEEVDLVAATLVVNRPGEPKPVTYLLLPQCRVWKGKGIGELTDIAPGQEVAINITSATLKGPGRAVEIWLDEESRNLAAQQQREIHNQFERDHGLPGYVESVDNEKKVLSVSLFENFDPALLDDFVVGEAVTVCVAEGNLRTYDQINDRKRGNLLEKQALGAKPGFSGIVLKFDIELLLEGFRPKKVIRIWPARWKLDDLPREEHHPEP